MATPLTHRLDRRQALAMAAALLLPLRAARAGAPLMPAMVRLDGLYIPALFLTGAAGKSDAEIGRAHV